MKNEVEPVTPDEFVIRLIWKTFFKVGRPLPISFKAFQPRKDEVDGISVFRASCIANPEDSLAVMDLEKRDHYGIALLNVGDIGTLGLSVQPSPIATIAGHAVLPELNIVRLTDDSKMADVQLELAVLANRRVVRGPKP